MYHNARFTDLYFPSSFLASKTRKELPFLLVVGGMMSNKIKKHTLVYFDFFYICKKVTISFTFNFGELFRKLLIFFNTEPKKKTYTLPAGIFLNLGFGKS